MGGLCFRVASGTYLVFFRYSGRYDSNPGISHEVMGIEVIRFVAYDSCLGRSFIERMSVLTGMDENCTICRSP